MFSMIPHKDGSNADRWTVGTLWCYQSVQNCKECPNRLESAACHMPYAIVSLLNRGLMPPEEIQDFRMREQKQKLM